MSITTDSTKKISGTVCFQIVQKREILKYSSIAGYSADHDTKLIYVYSNTNVSKLMYEKYNGLHQR